MQYPLLFFFLLCFTGASAQVVTTDPAAPVADQPLTITFDASQGTGGLRNCGCDIYLHTGVILPNSGEWQKVYTTWGVQNDAWKLTPVAGEPNKYTYTFSPTVREYYRVGADTLIQQIALVFRNANGSMEGKASGGQDIYIDINTADALALNLLGDPGAGNYPLGKALPVTAGTTAEATIQLFDNDSLLTSTTGQELSYPVRLTEPGDHTIRVVATSGDQVIQDSFSVRGELVLEITAPATAVVSASPGEEVTIGATSYIASTLRISDGATVVAQQQGETITQTVTLPQQEIITYTVSAAYRGDTASATVTYITGAPTVAEVPVGFRPGATPTTDGGLLLVLRAPQKSDVFVVGNFNNWSPVASGRMLRTPNDTTYWLKIPAADLPEGDFLYQYAVDGQGSYADPFSTLVLDPNDDPYIEASTFAGIPAYPTGKAEGIVSWLRLDAPEFAWQSDDYDRPDPEKMVVYELLIRDFLADHSYQSLTDTLDYLERLGINTIELMPVSEFEGNISWGYNVSFHMALDKYYGSPEDLKTFVDAAHARGIAVVLDVVYNHAFGESSLIQLWPGAQPYEPGVTNPYANVQARHPFNVGYDLNHESLLTQEYVKTSLTYWLEEFHVDGFRFDLSKGFTQNFTNSVDAWNKYDASRIAIIEGYADEIWSVNEDAYVIMEHLGESREENELAQYGQGMYFWSGFEPHNAYLEGAMGYNANSNLGPVLAANRGFDQPSLVAYMESHDEERMMWKNTQFGNSSGSYNVKNVPTALDRVKLASTLFYTLPGPKMLWQFGELGYDYPINYCSDGRVDNSCRTDPKPIVWEYRDEADRQEVYNTISDLLYLRNNFDYFHGEVTASQLAGEVKYAHLSSSDGVATVFGNFGVIPNTLTRAVPSAGTWYDYFSGEAVTVTNPDAAIELAPGEYHVYLSRPVERGGGRLTTGTNDAAVARLSFTVHPNPATNRLNTSFTLEKASRVTVTLLDLVGRSVQQLFDGELPAGPQTLEASVSGLPAGPYFLRVTDGGHSAVRQVIVR